jgi:hypothetical protein
LNTTTTGRWTSFYGKINSNPGNGGTSLFVLIDSREDARGRNLAGWKRALLQLFH